MNIIVTISEDENEKMMDIIEGINALKVLVQTLASDNELYNENSEMYTRIKNDLKNTMADYQTEWNKIIEKYHLDPEKCENYFLNFSDRSIQYVEN